MDTLDGIGYCLLNSAEAPLCFRAAGLCLRLRLRLSMATGSGAARTAAPAQPEPHLHLTQYRKLHKPSSRLTLTGVRSTRAQKAGAMVHVLVSSHMQNLYDTCRVGCSHSKSGCPHPAPQIPEAHQVMRSSRHLRFRSRTLWPLTRVALPHSNAPPRSV